MTVAVYRQDSLVMTGWWTQFCLANRPALAEA